MYRVELDGSDTFQPVDREFHVRTVVCIGHKAMN